MKTLDLIRRLVRIPSVTADRRQVNACSDFIAAYLRKRGLHVRVEKCGGTKIVFAATQPVKRCDILLNAHIDVVCADPGQFRPRLSRGKMIGRGALDCKGHAAVIMNLLPRLSKDIPVGALFTADEEEGGFTTRFMTRRGYRGRLVIVLDGNMDRVTVAQKGILSVRISARGKACHSSTPWRGENAIDVLLAGYRRIRRLFPPVSKKRSWRDTMAATVVKGGSVHNQVPDAAEMILNIRFTEKSRPRSIVRRLREVSGLSVATLVISPFVRIPESNPLVRLFLDAMKRRYNPAIRLGRMNGATDARHFIGAAQAIAITGLKGGGAHAADEWLQADSVGRLEKALVGFVAEDWRGGRFGSARSAD
jgi:succinyl-diaminopimelate desuccinylase